MKGGWLSIITYLLFYTVDKSIIGKYEQLVMYTAVILAVVEVTQVTNVVFKLSRFFKARIDFEKGILQVPCIVILMVTVLASWLLATNLASAVMSHVSYWLSIPFILSLATIIGMALFCKFEQGIVSNVACVGCYLAFASNMAF